MNCQSCPSKHWEQLLHFLLQLKKKHFLISCINCPLKKKNNLKDKSFSSRNVKWNVHDCMANYILDLPGALMAWPTLLDQPIGCRRGLHMWHQKSETVFSGASLWSAYTSRRRPPIIDSMMATRVRLTCLGSTTSTRMPTLKEDLMLSAS